MYDSAEISLVKELLDILGERFDAIHIRSHKILSQVNESDLFVKPEGSRPMLSSGEYLIRSAAKVEQTFGGITSSLWDDPFEWTLPEELSTKIKVADYLDEVEQTRKRGFAFFESDSDLLREIPAPEKMTVIFDLLLQTIISASGFQELAEAALAPPSF